MLFAVLYAAFLGWLIYSKAGMPDLVATHFNAKGVADGWTSASRAVTTFAVAAVAVPLLLVILMALMRFLPAWCFNLPRKDYWLAPERRRETMNYLLRHSLWLASLWVIFFAGVHLAVIAANRMPSPRLPVGLFFSVTGIFVAGMIAWVAVMFRHFAQVPQSADEVQP